MSKARACQAKNPETCSYHHPELALSSPPQKELTISERIQRDLLARAVEKQALLEKESKERIPNWETLGFQKPGETRYSESWVTYLKDKTPELTEEETEATKFYTSNNFKWINDALYKNIELPSSSDKKLNIKDALNHPFDAYKNPTKEDHRKVVALLDSAIVKAGDNNERMLYVGKSARDGIIQGSISDYVDANYKIGQTVDNAGYISATPSVNGALAFANSENGTGKVEGILFEMKTTKGLNVTNNSIFGREGETLLPRNTKWMVAAVHKSKVIRTVNDLKSTKNQKVTIIQMVEIP